MCTIMQNQQSQDCLTLAVSDGGSKDNLLAPTSCLMGAISVLVQEMYTWTTCINTIILLNSMATVLMV